MAECRKHMSMRFHLIEDGMLEQLLRNAYRTGIDRQYWEDGGVVTPAPDREDEHVARVMDDLRSDEKPRVTT